MLGSAFDNFVEKSPVSVMARGIAERALNPEKLDSWFEGVSGSQYTRDLLFSSVFSIMNDVVSGTHKTVHAAFQSRDDITVSIQAVYDKLKGIELETSAELVRYASGEAAAVMKEIGGTRPQLIPGLNLRIIDGNCIESTEHRIKELRGIAAGALPGKSLVVFDPALRLPVDVFPCEDGHAQERSLLKYVLPTVAESDVWVGDRNFCTTGFVCGIDNKTKAFFVIREHANLPFEQLTPMKKAGRVKGGQVFEQMVEVTDAEGNKHVFRRVRITLAKPTRDGDKRIHILTNLSKSKACATVVADIYRKRWTIETAFLDLAKHLQSEINTLGYPRAALFAFCIALVSYSILSLIMAALGAVHGHERVDNEVSGYYLADELSGMYQGMMVALPSGEWRVFRTLSFSSWCDLLVQLAANVRMARFKKHGRGPKKPQPKRKKDPKHPHVSTAKLLAKRRG
jgi:IS4 transposase